MKRETNNNRKQYERLSITPVRVQIESSILSGSVTDHQIRIADDGVQVVGFEKDNSFGTDGIWDISF